MAVGLMGTHCQRSVEQQHALLSPSCQIAALRNGCSQVLLYLLEDILQRGRKLHTVLHREAQPVGLSRFVIRVLSDNHHLHAVERTQVEGIEYQGAWRIARACRIFLTHSTRQSCEVRLLKFRLQMLLPRRFYLYIHYVFAILFAKIGKKLYLCKQTIKRL